MKRDGAGMLKVHCHNQCPFDFKYKRLVAKGTTIYWEGRIPQIFLKSLKLAGPNSIFYSISVDLTIKTNERM